MKTQKPSKIAIIGTGYVGLTTGACLAKLGHSVICADVVPEKVEQLQRGVIPIMEAGLEEVVKDGLASGRLRFVLGAALAVGECDFAFMCLPTPQGDDGTADLSYVLAAAGEIGPLLPTGAVVVNKSTVPAGSAQKVAAALGRRDIAVASNPEFLREGTAVHDFLHPDRIVIGAAQTDVAAQVARLYDGIDAPKMLVDTATAELIKYASNAFLATKISFANAIGNLCEAVGANAHQVLEGMGYDSRIGSEFLKPGPGWGGSCFPKDIRALIQIAETAGYNFDLLKAVVAANDVQTQGVIDQAVRLLRGRVKGAHIAVWGLAFKAGTDDLRQSPALRILGELTRRGAKVRAYDPGISRAPEGIILANNALAACDDADLLLVLTEWPEFARVSLASVAKRLKHRRLIDTRNCIDTAKLKALAFDYWSVGHGQSTSPETAATL